MLLGSRAEISNDSRSGRGGVRLQWGAHGESDVQGCLHGHHGARGSGASDVRSDESEPARTGFRHAIQDSDFLSYSRAGSDREEIEGSPGSEREISPANRNGNYKGRTVLAR